MKYFGNPWATPFKHPVSEGAGSFQRVEAPVGEACAHCHQPIQEGDAGYDTVDGFYHRDCFFEDGGRLSGL